MTLTYTTYESHPSILKIRENVTVLTPFSFSLVQSEEIKLQLKSLDVKKGIPFMNIPPKQLKEVIDIIAEPLRDIWNEEIIGKQKFPDKLKLADVSPIYKKLEAIFTNNYRPISVLPVVSKIFERIMDKQSGQYMEQYISPYLCGYRTLHGPQLALLFMVETWKMIRDKGGIAGGVLMDLSKRNYMRMDLICLLSKLSLAILLTAGRGPKSTLLSALGRKSRVVWLKVQSLDQNILITISTTCFIYSLIRLYVIWLMIRLHLHVIRTYHA